MVALLAAIQHSFRLTREFPSRYRLERLLGVEPLDDLLWEAGGDIVVQQGYRIAITAKGLWLTAGADEERTLLQQWLDELRQLRVSRPEAQVNAAPVQVEGGREDAVLLVTRVLWDIDTPLKDIHISWRLIGGLAVPEWFPEKNLPAQFEEYLRTFPSRVHLLELPREALAARLSELATVSADAVDNRLLCWLNAEVKRYLPEADALVATKDPVDTARATARALLRSTRQATNGEYSASKPDEPLFRLVRGDRGTWTLFHVGRPLALSARHADAGVGYLAELINNPGTQFSPSNLRPVTPLSSDDHVMDKTALRQALASSSEAADAARRAMSKRGKPRPLGPLEGNRKSVSKAIHRALAFIESVDAEAGEQLSKCVTLKGGPMYDPARLDRLARTERKTLDPGARHRDPVARRR